MQITDVTVSWGETQSLPEYCNIKPSVTLTARLEPGDDPAWVIAQLQHAAQAYVRGQVDDALEAAGLAAKYDPAPRYRVVRTSRTPFYDRRNRRRPAPAEQVVAILPAGAQIPDGYVTSYGAAHQMRYPAALGRATDLAARDRVRLIDCSDGDLSRLPTDPEEPEEVERERARQEDDERRMQQRADDEDEGDDDDDEDDEEP